MLEDAQSDARVPMQSNWLYSQLVNKMFPDLTRTKEKTNRKTFLFTTGWYNLVHFGGGASGVEALGSFIQKKPPWPIANSPLSIEVLSEEWDGVL